MDVKEATRDLIGAVDQGTSSTRFLVFDSAADVVAVHQVEVNQLYPQHGWVEEDPEEIYQSVVLCMDKVADSLIAKNIPLSCVKAVGITNQRESLVVWDRKTGKPLHNAIIWLDNRTSETVEKCINRCPGKNKYYFQKVCGLPLSTYFSALKLRWLMDNIPEINAAVKAGTCCVGTVDTWLLWRLTGGPADSSCYATDVTNASRTMLLDLKSLTWDSGMCEFFGIPKSILPQVGSSSEIYGHFVFTKFKGVPIAGILGDQQAALVGQRCFQKGLAKNTYGTGCFLLFNTGDERVYSKHGLLTTIAYQFGNQPATYALEGAVAVAGAGVQWLRDNLGIIQHADEVEKLARSVSSVEGCHFVPAFSGLLCPYWQPGARGIITGITQKTTKAHIARACLEAVCFQTSEVVQAMNLDSGLPLRTLLVDGGMSSNTLLMQMQADTLGIHVQRPTMAETTALGAAIAAALANGINFWQLETLPDQKIHVYNPELSQQHREEKLNAWKLAVQHSLNP